MSLATVVPAPIRDLLLRHAHGRRIWLVGGAVRDRLLDRPILDLDFVVDGEARSLARALANALEGHYFDLDAARDTGRVVRPRLATGVSTLDFARLRGPDILEDLAVRDFTLNALATPLDSPEQLLDPDSGLQDLKDRRLRACSATAIQDDPLRSLRGVRLALELDLRIDPATIDLIRAAGPGLERVAAERIRDEFMQMLRPAWAGRSIRLLERLGLLTRVCPELEPLLEADEPGRAAWQHTLSSLDRVAELLHVLVGRLPGDLRENLVVAEAALQLGRYRDRLQAILSARLAGERPADQLFCLAALYHASGGGPEEQAAQQAAALAVSRCRALRLSSGECSLVQAVIRAHWLPARYDSAEALSPLELHRYFRAAGEAGVLAALLQLAVYLADQDTPADLQKWRQRLQVARAILEARFERYEELIEPSPLLRGHELIAELGIPPGPAVGETLRALAEAQVQGIVQTREQALDHARDLRGQEGRQLLRNDRLGGEN
jgi:tRNA nucleotidyltransferase/poly(A) polymerase